MSYSGGVFSRLYSWINDKNNGLNIDSTRMDNEMNGMAIALSTCMLKDGTQNVTANIPLNGFKLTGVGDATAAQDAVNLETLQSGSGLIGSSVAGTNSITFNVSPAVSAYKIGQEFRFVATGNNTGATTINVNSIGAVAAYKKSTSGPVACVGGEIVAGNEYASFYDGSHFQFSGTSAGNAGTVTSVTFTGDGTILSSTPTSPVTSTGTLPATLVNQSANHILAGPTSGAAAAPTFRALVAADLPSSSLPNIYTWNPSDPTGTSSTTPVMMGLGAIATFTPLGFGVVYIDVPGDVQNSGPAGLTTVQLCYGTGAAPSNGAALTVTPIGTVKYGLSGTFNQGQTQFPFSVSRILGLTPGGAIWIDLAVSNSAGNTSSVKDLTINVFNI
jgi:hypothetical protein